MKKLLVLLSVIVHTALYAQFCPALGPDQLLPCGVGSTTLTANLANCGPGGANPNQTTSYSVASIPYVAQTNTGTQLFMTDDSQQGPFPIGFNFCFYGQTYTQFYIGSNGWISFTGGQPTTFTTQTIPTANPLVPKNCIMGPWQDWHPGIGGQIRYQTSGVAPCRKLTVSWIGVPMFSCTGNQGTFHIVIYESTNYIENHIQDKPACLAWQGGTATEGIHNNTGTLATAVPGRNSSAWTATNDSWRWTPTGPTVLPVLTWYQIGNPVAIGTGPTITVTPPAAGAQYTCRFVYPICNAGWSNCNAIAGLGPDTVLVIPGPPNLPAPTVLIFDPSCNTTCDGAINVTANGTNGIATISWPGQPNTFTLTNLCGGVYPFTITDALGCTVSGTATLTNPPVPVVGPITYNDTVCFGSTSETYSVPNQLGYSYSWASVGNITNGQGTNTIDVDWSSTTAGFIPGAVQVTGYNINNCPSLPVAIDLNVFNIIPVIDPLGPFCSNDEFTVMNATPIGGIFTGTGVMGNEFYPGFADTLNNNVVYTYTQSGCVFDDTVNVIVYEQPQISQITPYNDFYEVCEGDSVAAMYSVVSTLSGGYNEWTLSGNTTQSTNFNIAWNSFGMFPLTVVNWVNGCPSNQQQSVITIVECPNTLFYIPNSFTPDGDENNNIFKWVFTSGFDPYSFNITVYNRWGECIFESNDPNGYWDGTYNNTMCQAGIYAYRVFFKHIGDDGKHEMIGNLLLLK